MGSVISHKSSWKAYIHGMLLSMYHIILIMALHRLDIIIDKKQSNCRNEFIIIIIVKVYQQAYTECIHLKPPAGKNLGPANPLTRMLWMSMFPPRLGLRSLIKMNLPDLFIGELAKKEKNIFTFQKEKEKTHTEQDQI